MTKEYDLFISYSSKDKSFVIQLAEDLKEQGLDIWLDLWEMKPGDRLRDRISDAISHCDRLLVLLSPNSINSSWVKVELDSAMIRELESQQVIVIPTMYGKISDKEIPADLKGKMYLDFRNPAEYETNLDRIVRLVDVEKGTDKVLKKLANSHMKFIYKPWRILWPGEERAELFAYKSLNGADGVCRVERINLSDGRVVILCEELWDNPGRSVTNSVEDVAFQICYQYEIDPQKLVFIEHYELMHADKEEWLLVSFEKIPPESGFEVPSWRAMTREDWHSLGFRPRKKTKRRKYSMSHDSGVIWYKLKQ